ncbi:MAG: GerAB/ArcD/ProY family transporter [Provencibacterium sp.]|jgi:spore germination protein KB|nr:GerAB/ArcD/ProY family transporter [Provencibacterium sp.]
MLLLCRTYTFFTAVPGFTEPVSGSGALVSLLFSALFSLAALLPAWLVLRRSGTGILEYAYQKSKTAGYACSTLFGLGALFSAADCAVQYDFFITGAIYPNERNIIFIVLFTLCALYMAWMGLEAVARFSGPLLIALLFSLGLIILSLIREFDPLGMSPPDLSAFPAMLQSAYSTFSETGELVLALLFLPYLKGNVKKGFAGWLAAAVLLLGTVIATAIYTVQDYAATQNYPFYAIAKTALLFYFQRMDALHMVLWTMIGLVKMTLYLYICRQCFSNLCGPRVQRWLLLGEGAAVIALGLVFSFYLELFRAAYRILLSGVPLLLLVSAVPLALGLLPRKRKGDAAVEK